MKPRITKIPSLCQWFCYGGGFIGIGRTPRDAYWQWQHNEREHQRREFERARQLGKSMQFPKYFAA